MSSQTEDLQSRWNELYRSQLPALAKKEDAVQRRWPVHLDHCFARIVLDNAIGQDRPWTEVVKQPAVKNMTDRQVLSAIRLAEEIAAGRAGLEDLNERSLELRGKKTRMMQKDGGKKRKADLSEEDNVKKQKRRREDGDVSSYFLPSPAKSPRKSKINIDETDAHTTEPQETPPKEE